MGATAVIRRWLRTFGRSCTRCRWKTSGSCCNSRQGRIAYRWGASAGWRWWLRGTAQMQTACPRRTPASTCCCCPNTPAKTSWRTDYSRQSIIRKGLACCSSFMLTKAAFKFKIIKQTNRYLYILTKINSRIECKNCLLIYCIYLQKLFINFQINWTVQ